MDAIYTEQYKGMTIEIIPDDDALDPQEEWDEFGTMVCWHRHYNLGKAHKYADATDFMEKLARELDYKKYDKAADKFDADKMTSAEFRDIVDDIVEKNTVMLDLFLYDHSGISMKSSSASFRAVDSAGWDWGQVGFYYATREQVIKEFGSFNKSAKEKARKLLNGEIETYDDYLTGNVYGFRVLDQQGEDDDEGEELDSCWGFVGDYDDEGGCLDEARRAADYHAKKVNDEIDTIKETTYA